MVDRSDELPLISRHLRSPNFYYLYSEDMDEDYPKITETIYQK